jgi:hypothetical protein
MDIITGLFSSLGSFGPVIGIFVLYLFLRQRKKQEYDIPPLDLVDAKKLDDMVSKQVEDALRPILQSEGYTEEQMKEVLTRSSVGTRRFRR